MNVLILGINGFIGSHLVQRILKDTDWIISGIDLFNNRLKDISDIRLEWIVGDIYNNIDWIDKQIQKSDVVLPLAAIATPKLYITDPIEVFNLDFKLNLVIVEKCVKYKKRLLFPSTSEVYGASSDKLFNEDVSPLIVGPICKERWIYSCCKQLMDRVIYAYGIRDYLPFTIFRPFNWIGPKLDSLEMANFGNARVVTQFVADLLAKRPIRIVDGGHQRRCFTYIDDGIDALMKIIENKDNGCDKEIINIGNPDNDCSILELAYKVKDIFINHSEYGNDTYCPEIIYVKSEDYYGKGYQDPLFRKPDITKANKILDWTPLIDLQEALIRTMDSFL